MAGWFSNASACAALAMWNFQDCQNVMGWIMVGTAILSVFNAVASRRERRS